VVIENKLKLNTPGKKLTIREFFFQEKKWQAKT